MSADVHSDLTQSVDVQSQFKLQSRVSKHKPMPVWFEKQRPIVGWSLRSPLLQDIPEIILAQVGEVDSTSYTQDYLADNQGSIIALQMDGNEPDFYIIQKKTFLEDYSAVDVFHALKHNPALEAWLTEQPELVAELSSEAGALVGARKSVPVKMLTMSSIGYPIEKNVTIRSPWGEQSKPAGEEAYLAIDKASGEYYLINQGDSGHPLSYVPAP